MICDMCNCEIEDNSNHTWEGYPICKDCHSIGVKTTRFFKWVLVALVILVLGIGAHKCNGAVTEDFLDRVAKVESGNSSKAIGDNGRSLGLFQMSFASWLDVNEIRQKQGLKLYPYNYATNRTVARIYARQYLLILHRKVSAKLGRPATQAETYAAYNAGFSAFLRDGLDLSRVPKTTKQNIAKLNL